MREWRSRCSMVVLMVAWMIASWPAIANAAARVIIPSDWGESASAAPEAQRRASRWQAALELRLVQVASAPQNDRFAETIAVFERNEAIAERVFADEAAAVDALAAAVADVVGTDAPKRAEFRSTSAGQRIVWARWIVDDLSYECVLAPSGDSTTIVIAAVLASESEIQSPLLAEVFTALEGVSEPMPRFSLFAWRLGSIVVWLALALGLHAAMLPLGDRDHDHGQAGRRAAVINFVLVLIGTGIAVVALRGRELALSSAGSSVAGLAVWIAIAGVIVVGLHFLISSRLDHGPVQSAPSSGAFASGTYSTADVIRSSVSRSGMRRVDDLESSSNWPPPTSGSSQNHGRIVIDESERE